MAEAFKCIQYDVIDVVHVSTKTDGGRERGENNSRGLNYLQIVLSLAGVSVAIVTTGHVIYKDIYINMSIL